MSISAVFSLKQEDGPPIIVPARPVRSRRVYGKGGLSMPGDSVIIIPTYNEAQNIQRLISAIRDVWNALSIVIVDDGSLTAPPIWPPPRTACT